MKLLVTIPNRGEQNGFLTQKTREYLEEHFEVVYNESKSQLTTDDLARLAPEAEIAITGWGSPSFVGARGTESIKFIAHTGGSVGDLVDDGVYERGVRVSSGNSMYAESVAEGTLAYMMSILRSIPDEVYGMRDGHWYTPGVRDSEGLFDQEVGIIGYGAISKNLMRMLKPFRVRLKVYSAHPIDEDFLREVGGVQTSLEDIFSTSKIVSLHSSLNERTVGMIGKEHFEMMREGAVFINTARGALVREDEMIEVLSRRDIRAFLDVYSAEPLSKDSPLRSMKNVYLMPHRGGPTLDRRQYIGRAIAEEAVRFKNGEPLTLEIPRAYAGRMTKHSTRKK